MLVVCLHVVVFTIICLLELVYDVYASLGCNVRVVLSRQIARIVLLGFLGVYLERLASISYLCQQLTIGVSMVCNRKTGWGLDFPSNLVYQDQNVCKVFSDVQVCQKTALPIGLNDIQIWCGQVAYRMPSLTVAMVASCRTQHCSLAMPMVLYTHFAYPRYVNIYLFDL